jgi:hypothetical protein
MLIDFVVRRPVTVLQLAKAIFTDVFLGFGRTLSWSRTGSRRRHRLPVQAAANGAAAERAGQRRDEGLHRYIKVLQLY